VTAIPRNQRYTSRRLDVRKRGEGEGEGGGAEWRLRLGRGEQRDVAVVAVVVVVVVVVVAAKEQEEDEEIGRASANKGGCYFRMKGRGRPPLVEPKIKAAEDSGGGLVGGWVGVERGRGRATLVAGRR